ncbi:hypothetical protein MX629_02095 [Carnobacterium divergens]|uniref:Bacterial Ig domain-containing protein n=1 Tax=Carnobacterium divergens TaxID=2748 RepID=A0AAW8RA72_CARDV|nr:immunoglobulin-like domain-containing protein [Carnobacterium divergens]MDT1957211.1 hypothetical protein [Carnobacterium divergens]MDT1973181.1 hypothetical protein [Carnobacterium divergens]
MKKNVKKSVVSLVSFVSVAGVLSGSIIPVSAAAETLNNITQTNEEDALVGGENNNSTQYSFTEEQQKMIDDAKEISKSGAQESEEMLRASGYDKDITSISLIAKESKNRENKLSFTEIANSSNVYEGEVTEKLNIPISGRLNGSNILIPNGPEFIEDYENGNIGVRVNFKLPEGTEAKNIVKIINWEKSNQTTKGVLNIRWLGIPLPIKCQVGTKWDKDSIQYSANKPNEFSMALRSIKKSEVSTAEWNKYNPLETYAALTAAGILHSGTGEGEMEGALSLDFSKYEGNSDDISADKVITSNKLSPAKDGKFNITAHVIDRSGLISGLEGKKNLSKAEIKPGMSYSNPIDSNPINSWDSYLSIWDNESKYNINKLEEPEMPGANTTLAGESIFNRDLVVTKGDDFNTFASNRFDRVINYYTKENVTDGSVGTIDSVKITHGPSKVQDNVKTAVKYTGTVTYVNGDTRQLIPNILNVTNNSKPATEGTIKADDFTIGDANITGTYTGDVARLRLYINGVSVAWGGMLENGKFTFYAANQHISANDVVTLNAYDKDDNLLQENAPVKLNNATVAGSISPAEYSIGDTEITGSYTGDVAKARITINGKVQSWGGSFTNGHFSYYVGTGKIKAGDKVTITAYDKNDKVLDANKPVKIKANATQGTITPANFSLDDMNITGTYTGDVAQARVTINGKAQAWGGSFTNGRFSYYVGANKIKSGDNVTITAYDRDGKVLDQNKKVTINEVSKGSIAPSTYRIGETTIKGTYTGNIVRARVFINGTPQAWGGSFNGGSFSYYVGAGKIKAGDVVTIIGYSADNSEIDTQKINVQS